MIQAIFFDLDGTQIDRAAAHRRYYEDFLARYTHAVPPERRDAVFEALVSCSHHWFWGRDSAFRHCLQVLPPGLGLSFAALDADYVERLPRYIEPDSDILQLLEGLSGRYTLATITNGSRRFQRAKIERAGLTGAVGRVFLSAELGVRKPDTGIFRRALDWAGVAP
jgi:FMN phosphatase YigB (HAD superfamily)